MSKLESSKALELTLVGSCEICAFEGRMIPADRVVVYISPDGREVEMRVCQRCEVAMKRGSLCLA
jgi:hypothetical protein